MRNTLESGIAGLTFVVALALVMSISVTATSVEIVGDGSNNDVPVAPGESGIEAFSFDVIYGDDFNITGTAAPGTEVNSFEENETMFLNQHSGVGGLHGYVDGDDVVAVEELYNGTEESKLNGTAVGNFSEDIYFADSMNTSAMNTSEPVINSSTGLLSSESEVLVSGNISGEDFHEDMKFVDSGSGELDAGAYGNEVLVNSSDSILRPEDDVFALDEGLPLDEFDGDTTRYVREDDSQDEFKASSAIVRQDGDLANIFERDDDEVVRDGKADMINALETNLIVTPVFRPAAEDDGIYYSESGDWFVNVSDVRLGDYTVFSGENEENVSLGLDLLSKLNESAEAPHTNDLNKNLDIYTEGSFRVLEYDDSVGGWDPEQDNQQVLVYDFEDDGVSRGDVVLYDSDPESDNITVGPGEAFTAADVEEMDEPEDNFSTTGEPGYVDIDGSGEYTEGDEIVIQIAGSGEDHVVVAPNENVNELRDEHNSQGDFARWNVDGLEEDVFGDGFYIDVNETGETSHGDVRLAHWNAEVELGDNGTVEEGDLDLGAEMRSFQADDDAYVLNRRTDDGYHAGTGILSDNVDKGREAIIRSEDEGFLNASDIIIREGWLNTDDNWDDMRYIDAIQTEGEEGVFSDGEAVVRIAEGSTGLDNESEVILSGEANMTGLDEEVRYIDTEGDGFNQDTDPVIFDHGNNNSLELGSLHRDETDSDFVYTAREGNLQNFNRSFEEEGDVKTVFLDEDDNGTYTVGERIIEIEMLRNGSENTEFDGIDIVNFAESTRHTDEQYTGNETIVNDTAMNEVYQNVVEGIDLENIVSTDTREEFFVEANETPIDSGFTLYREEDEEWIEEGGLSHDSGLEWTGDFSTNITENTSFRLEFDSAPSGDLEDLVYELRGEASLDLAGGSIDEVLSENTQQIDAYPPEMVDAWTGDTQGGNSSERDSVFVKVEPGAENLDYNSMTPGLFALNGIEDTEIIQTSDRDNNNIEIRLNRSISTDQNFTVKVAEDAGPNFRDNIGNTRHDDNVSVQDGLRPEITLMEYIDRSGDGVVDGVIMEFTENVSYSYFEEDDWEVEEQEIPGLSIVNGTTENNDTLVLNASAEDKVTGVFEDEPFLDYSGEALRDNAGNSLAMFNKTMDDGAAPLIYEAWTSDEENNALLDRLDIQFTEPIDDNSSSLVTDSFDVEASDVEDVESIEGDDNISLEIDSELGTGGTPDITLVNNTVFDPDNNSLDSNQTFNATSNTADPVLLHSQINPDYSDYFHTFVDLTFSEPVEGQDEEIDLEGKELEFVHDQEASTRTVNYSELLNTGDRPNITGIENVNDLQGNEASMLGADNVTVNSFRNEMVEGWNFLSFPIADEEELQINETINTSKVDVIWTYRDGEWRIHDPEASVNDFDTFKGGAGYMVNAEEEFTVAPNFNTLRPNLTGSDLLQASLSIGDGYNLVGPFQEFTVAADNSDEGAFGALDTSKVDTVWRQENDGERELENIRDSAATDPGDMHPGEAYWMKWKGETAVYSQPVIGGD